MKDDTLAGGLPGLSVKRPHLAAVMNILIIIAGISALLGVEVRELPDVDRPIVTRCRANYPGGSPETTVDAEVTKIRSKRAVARVNGVKSPCSSSSRRKTILRIRAEFQPLQSISSDAANDVREAVSRISNASSPTASRICFVIKADARREPDYPGCRSMVRRQRHD